MREKEPCYVISFYTTADALTFERKAEKASFPGRLIPLPSTISAGCGMAWKIKKQEVDPLLLSSVDSFSVPYEMIHDIML